jgi:hypothetical protein
MYPPRHAGEPVKRKFPFVSDVSDRGAKGMTPKRARALAISEEHVRRSLVVTVVELVGLVVFASVLVLVLIGIPMLAAWVQVGR